MKFGQIRIIEGINPETTPGVYLCQFENLQQETEYHRVLIEDERILQEQRSNKRIKTYVELKQQERTGINTPAIMQVVKYSHSL
jgi:hypothetical protein